jgi:hypothetical protein
MPKEGDTPKKLPDGKDGKEAKAPKDLDLTPLEKAPDGDSRRPF